MYVTQEQKQKPTTIIHAKAWTSTVSFVDVMLRKECGEYRNETAK